MDFWDTESRAFLDEHRPDYASLSPAVDAAVEKISAVIGAELVCVGSWANHTALASDLCVDVIADVPKGSLRQKDYLDGRYGAKRTAFLDTVVSTLCGAGMEADLVHLGGSKMAARASFGELPPIRVIPALPTDAFPLQKLGPARRNDRRGEGDGPTPAYNNAILEDVLLRAHDAHVRQALSTDNTRDAAFLLRIWLRRRSLTDDLPGYFPSSLISSLLASGQITEHMTSFFMFRAAMDHLTGTELTLVDASGQLNLVGYVGGDVAADLAAEARLTVDALQRCDEATRFDTFDRVLVADVDPMLKYDDYVAVDDAADAAALAGLLRHGLGTRARLVRAVAPGVIGVALDPTESLRGVDVGPRSTDVAAARAFREFWGDKAELRRFRDGTMCEAVVWGVAERHRIVVLAAQHLFQRHASIPPVSVSSTAVAVMSQIAQQHDIASLHRCFELLALWLRGIRSIPLPVTSVTGIHPALRGVGVKPVGRDEALGVVVGLESSGAWPSDLAAMRSMKAAFLLRIADELTESRGVATAPCAESLDVMCLSGAGDRFVFRVCIASDLEMALADSDDVRRELSWRPRHAVAMHAVAADHPAYALAVSLALQWLSTHMFSGVPCETVELIVASVFVDAMPYAVPGSGVAAFTRTLHLLAHHPWGTKPLAVDVGGKMTGAMRRAIDAAFVDSDAPLFVASAMDPEGVWWPAVERGVWARVVAAAKASLGPPLSPFLCDMARFDAVIRLARGKKRRRETETQGLMPLAGYDPAGVVVSRLEAAYGHIALFFRDAMACGSEKAIGVVWRRRAFLPSRTPQPGFMPLGDGFIPNMPEFFSGVAEIGGDFVGDVVVL